MTPDDFRHGTYAGFQRHSKEREEPCTPCRDAQRAYFKRMKYRLHVSGPERVELGQEAWAVIDSMGRRELARTTGLRDSYLSRLHGSGPGTKVYRRTRDAILRSRGVTPVGVQRRLRALHAIGYSGAYMASEIKVSVDAVRRLVVARRPAAYHHERVADAVVELYERLAYTTPEPSRSTSSARNRALRRGFHAPAAWDDIDDPNEQPGTIKRSVGRPPRKEDVLQDFEWLTSQGVSDEHAAARVGVKLATIRDYQRQVVAA